MGEYKTGDKVRFVSAEKNKENPEYYPPAGTVGEVKVIEDDYALRVQWEKGSTSGNDLWWCFEKDIERIE